MLRESGNFLETTLNQHRHVQLFQPSKLTTGPDTLETKAFGNFLNVYLAMEAPKSRLDVFLAAIDSSSKNFKGSLPFMPTTSGGQNSLPALRSLLAWRTGTNSDHPLFTNSALRDAFQLPAKVSFKAPIAGLIIHCLYFLGCETDSIFRVLESHNLCDSVDLVARYIEEIKPLRHHEYGPFPEGRRTHFEPHTGTTCITDFSGNLPEQYIIRGKWISKLVPKTIVWAPTQDGREIITTVKEGELRCFV